MLARARQQRVDIVIGRGTAIGRWASTLPAAGLAGADVGNAGDVPPPPAQRVGPDERLLSGPRLASGRTRFAASARLQDPLRIGGAVPTPAGGRVALHLSAAARGGVQRHRGARLRLFSLRPGDPSGPDRGAPGQVRRRGDLGDRDQSCPDGAVLPKCSRSIPSSRRSSPPGDRPFGTSSSWSTGSSADRSRDKALLPRFCSLRSRTMCPARSGRRCSGCGLGVHYLVATLGTLLFVLRYGVSSRFIWSRPHTERQLERA